MPRPSKPVSRGDRTPIELHLEKVWVTKYSARRCAGHGAFWKWKGTLTPPTRILVLVHPASIGPFKIERELGRGGTSIFDVVRLSFSHHGNRVLAVMPVSSARDRSISIIQNWPTVVAPQPQP